MKTGKIPKEWKIALVSAIYKRKGDKHNPVNYRPISLTSIVCKILESIIRDSLMKYLKANGILSDRQFGFLAGRSTTLQLLRVVDEWTEIIDNGGVIDAIYCDFQKAFDTVPHNRLLEVLEFYGIKGSLLTWFRNFLTNRLQQVAVNGTKSETFEVLSGVPQGSVIGPVLFIIYINTMVAKFGKADIYLFADDLKLYKEIKSSDQSDSLQSELDRLYDWTQYSLLKFHPEKCVVMRFGSGKKHMETKPFYNMDETMLKVVDSEKDLGIDIDNQLTFDNHISRIVKKANAIVGMIRRSFVHLDAEIFKRLFTSIVRPHLEYGAPVWNPHTKKNIDIIENVQRRSSKRIPGMQNLSYAERLRRLKLPTLSYRRYRGDMIEMYKISHGCYDDGATKDLLNYRSHALGERPFRGHMFTIYKDRFRKDTRKYSFKCRVTDQWNNLPAYIVESPTLNTFKNKLDKLWDREGISYNPDIDIHLATSSRHIRYQLMEDEN